jgi:hypothetical protein
MAKKNAHQIFSGASIWAIEEMPMVFGPEKILKMMLRSPLV